MIATHNSERGKIDLRHHLEMNRVDKLLREERRAQIGRDGGVFFENMFSRRIYGLVWFLFLFAGFSECFLLYPSKGGTVERGLYVTSLVCAIIVAAIVVILLSPSLRRSWMTLRSPIRIPTRVRAILFVVPLLSLGLMMAILIKWYRE